MSIRIVIKTALKISCDTLADIFADIFLIWGHGEKLLKVLMNQVKVFHPTEKIQFWIF